MSDHLKLWRKVEMTDPMHVKPITGKQYRGNSPKPYYIVYRLTEAFGPCGIGWGFSVLSERMENLGGQTILHIAVVRFWYVLDGVRGELEQIGQTKAAYVTKANELLTDEDAPKKSVTDALVKCASYLGFAGDIFIGLWDDPKYVQHATAEIAKREATEETEDIRLRAMAILELAAKQGTEAYRLAWQSISNDMRKAAKGAHERLKAVALAVDEELAVANAAS